MAAALQKIIRVGSSLGVTIPKHIREELLLSEGETVRVSFFRTDSERRERVAELTNNFIVRYRKDLETLAKK